VRWLSIDPGAKTGITKWVNGNPVECLTIQTGKVNGERRVQKIAWEFLQISEGYQEAVVEIPGTWTRDGKNVAALMGLSMIVGAIQGVCVASGIVFRGVPVAEWKGKGTKADTKFAVEAEFGPIARNEHERDSVHMGAWWWASRVVRRHRGVTINI